MAGWSSGWVEIPSVGSPQIRYFNFTHNLGTSDLVFSVYWYRDQFGFPNPTDPISVEDAYETDNGFNYGSKIKILNDNDITLSLMRDGFSEGDWRPFLTPSYIKVVAISAVADPTPTPTPVPGTGDLCKILSADSGYQMFRNGLTIQWMSSAAFTDQDQSRTVSFPIPFASKPFKVTCSTRNPEGTGLSGVVNIETTNWTNTSVTLMSQAEGDKPEPSRPYYADIIAIGIAEVTDCPPASGEADDVDGIKVSELVDAKSLKDDDLFLISRDNETDGIFDTSNNVTFEQIKEGVINSIPPADLNNEFISFLSPSICTRGFTNSAGVAGELTFWHDHEWMHPVFNGLSVNLLTKEVYERYYWHRNFGKEAFYSRSNNTFYNPHGYSSPSAVMWDNSTPATFSTQDASLGLVAITVNRNK
jgi:hypothetical protein